MGKRSRRRARADSGADRGGAAVEATEYTDPEGGVLALRDRLSAGTLRVLDELGQGAAPAAASQEDIWQRRSELLFERLALRWTIAGLPLEGQKELLGRYRLADSDTKRWVRETIDAHLRERRPPG